MCILTKVPFHNIPYHLNIIFGSETHPWGGRTAGSSAKLTNPWVVGLLAALPHSSSARLINTWQDRLAAGMPN